MMQNNRITALKRKKKSLKNYFDKRCSSTSNCKPREFWKTIKPFMGENSKGKSEIHLMEGETLITGSSDVFNMFNNCYICKTDSIGKDEYFDPCS